MCFLFLFSISLNGWRCLVIRMGRRCVGPCECSHACLRVWPFVCVCVLAKLAFDEHTHTHTHTHTQPFLQPIPRLEGAKNTCIM